MLKKLALAFFLSLAIFLQSLFLVSLQKDVFAQSCGGDGAVCTSIGSQASCCTGYTCKSSGVPGNATGTCQQSGDNVNYGGLNEPCTESRGCEGSLICSSGNTCVNPTGIDATASVNASASNKKDPFPEIGLLCSQQRDVEFHSLRPYQAAPCGDSIKVEYCSNDLIFVEAFDMAGKSDSCQPRKQNGDFTCNPDYKVYPHNLYVSLDDSDLPILGNTEDVKNSQSSSDTYDDARKVNEYVSWYLNGVNTRAEYGEATNDQIVNFSGPIQKLLPSAIAEAQRVKIIDSFDKVSPSTSEVDGSTTEDARNHNQTVVCADKAIQLPSWLSWLPIIGKIGIGKSTAVPCYGGANKYKLSSWRESNSLADSVKNTIKDYVSKYLEGSGNLAAQLFDKAFIDRWDKKMPPLPWSDKNEKPFATSEAYRKAYNEWRGDLCAILPNPFGGKEILLCIGIPGITNNEFADLFPFVPLAETPDKAGAEKINAVQMLPGGGTKISGERFGRLFTPPLYFAHTEEVKQLSETLNSTYIPKDVKSAPIPETTEKNICSVANVRANPGDNLFPGNNNELQVQAVEYVITEATCHETYVEVCERDPENGHESCHMEDTLECPADVTIKIKTSTLTPNADEIFSTTVADSASTFRKIFPKVEEGAPVSCIADIPTVTNVTYDPHKDEVPGSQSPRGGSLTFSVKNFPEDGTNTTPQLTFPHLGSVYEYFLKGIQTALRPKGYGGPIANGSLCEPTETTTSVCDGRLFAALGPPTSTTSQASTFFQSNIKSKLTHELMKIYAQAEKETGVPCEILAGVHFEEGGNNTNQSLQNGGPLSGTLLASAIQAGNEIKAKVGGTIDSWDKAITALSRYNGGGNRNCGRDAGYIGPCPPPEGIDDLYPTAWLDAAHINMYLVYCSDHTQCAKPYPLVIRPGVLTIATELFLTEK